MYKNNSAIQFPVKGNKTMPLVLGLKGLASECDHDMMVYVLRSLYHEIFKAKKRKETKEQLYRRIVKFEKDCLLPGYLSAMPVDQLLAELEDAQYFYPIRKHEIDLPKFH